MAISPRATAKYDPSYCEKIIEWGKSGKGIEEFYEQPGISQPLIERWITEHPEFKIAVNESARLCHEWVRAQIAKGEIFDEDGNPIQFPLHYKPGRPTKYRPEYCLKVIEWGLQGKTCAYICSQLGISFAALTFWLANFPEFKEAYDIGLMHVQNWWEEKAQSALLESKDGVKLNNTLYTFYMRNRFKESYTENTQSMTVSTVVDTQSIDETIKGKLDVIAQKLRQNGNGHKPASTAPTTGGGSSEPTA